MRLDIGRLREGLTNWITQRFPLLRRMITLAQRNINLELPRSHSERYKSRAFWFGYPLYYLGGMIFVLFVIEAITGVLLGLYYVPSASYAPGTRGEPGDPSLAYQSVVFIMTKVPFGNILRGIHHWGAHLLIVATGLHMIRVFFTSAYRRPRELNWVLGVVLLLGSILLGFTGYLLPWDQLGFWASTIGLEITKSIPLVGEVLANVGFGGTSLSARTLTRMYLFHWVLAGMGFLLAAIHIFVVWMQGIAEPH
ncbi:MAG: cytochrome bc complex cytochrome b subunit [Candidatus Bathyarchaeia archaeon]